MRWRFVLVVLLLAIFYSASWRLAQVDPGKLLTGLPKMAGWAAKAWPPATDELPVLLLRTAETIAMAAIGTTAAALLALPVCVIAARNVTPSLALYYPARWFLNALRGVDSFQQRVAIARALAQRAKVILADEPVASLDPESSATVLQSLRSAVATGVAVVASLHQVHLARAYADRILALRHGHLVHDAPTDRLDVRSIEQIYERAGERSGP